MRKFAIIFIGFVLFSVNVCAAAPENFDIFGVDDKTKQLIHSECAKLISKYLLYTTQLFSSSSAPSNQQLKHKLELEMKIISKARQFDDFTYAKVSTVNYPIDKETYATLDLVKSTDKHRLPRQKRLYAKKTFNHSKEVNELFGLWETYLDKKLDLMRKNQLDFNASSCPVLHCVWGFDQHELKDILPKLKGGATKHKSALQKIIQHDTDNQKREEAVFILAHGDDYNELAQFLIKFTDDPNESVRNNVMRVLGAIVSKYEVSQLDFNRILSAVNYPCVTDRNKAAYVLLGIVRRDSSTHQLVIDQAGDTLLELLKLKQPNNHGFAFEILKVISQQSYQEQDYSSWEKWIHSHQTPSQAS